jgi:predicted GTPase
MDAVVLCDVKFGAGPIQAAIDYLIVEKRYRVLGAALIAKKVPEGFTLEVPYVVEAEAGAAVRRAAAEFGPRAVVDVTEAALAERFSWANEALQLGLEVHGADFRLWPPVLKGGTLPTVTFAGAGAAVGKTAAIIYFLEQVKAKYKTAAVVLDLGGPSYPEVVEPGEPASASRRLLSYYRDGCGVGGDHYLLATATGVPAVGCAFAGTGLTGVPLNSLLGDAFVFAAEKGGELVVVEGSGGAMPPAAGAVCFLVNVSTRLEVLRTFPSAFQLRKACVVVATGFTAEPPPEAFEALRAEVRAANPRAAFCYGRLAAAPAGEPLFKDAVVVTARPEGEREELSRHWGKEIRGAVLQVIGADEFPPAAPLAKSLRREGADAGLLLDMAAPNLGEWLAWADSWDVPACPTYEVLVPSARVSERLLKAALKAAR